MLISEFITDLSYSLRNASGEFDDAELMSYLNRAYECLYKVLVKMKNEKVKTGTGSFSTTAGSQSYDLTASGINITDLWVPHRVWVSGSELMDVCYEEDLYDTINQEEDGNTGHRTEPTEYCLIGSTVWFKESPDDTYTVEIRYFPSFTTLTDYTANMPLSGIFNMSLLQAVEMYAKTRNEMNPSLDIQLMEMFKAEALFMLGKRSKKNVRFSFDKRLRRKHR